jgi:hypothetical protein
LRSPIGDIDRRTETTACMKSAHPLPGSHDTMRRAEIGGGR